MPVSVIWLVCGFILLMPAADMVVHWDTPASVGAELTRDRGRFNVVNALTLTGFAANVGPASYTPAGQWVFFILTLAGILFTNIVGAMAAVRILRLPYGDGQIARFTAVATLVLTVLGAVFLANRAPLDALALSASAFGHGGLVLGRRPGMLEWETHLVLMPLAVIGSVGIPVLMEGLDVLRRRRVLSFYSRTVVALTAGAYLLFFALFFLARFSLEEVPTLRHLIDIAGSSSVQAINSRTVGFPFEYGLDFSRGMQWLVLIAMAVGGSPASSAGGIKTTTLYQLYRSAYSALRPSGSGSVSVGRPSGRSFGIAAAWVGIYLLLVMVVFACLLATVPQLPSDRLLFETVSALSNAGLSYEVVVLVTPGLDILSVAMVLGRLAPLFILWWMAQTTRDSDLVIG